MTKTISIKEILGEDIRSRKNANIIRKEIEDECYNTIDMSGVIFISRSFADELLAVSEEKNAQIINAQNDVLTMLDLVEKSRSTYQSKTNINDKVTRLDDMESLSKFFATIQ